MIEPPYIPFYKPYGMSDEEFEHEVRIAEEAYAQWENEQMEEQTKRNYKENGIYEDNETE